MKRNLIGFLNPDEILNGIFRIEGVNHISLYILINILKNSPELETNNTFALIHLLNQRQICIFQNQKIGIGTLTNELKRSNDKFDTVKFTS